MKIYLNNPNEGWVVDRFRKEFYKNHQEATENPHEANVVWIIAPWTWRQIHPTLLAQKKVVCSIHHIVPDKFDHNKKTDFLFRDRFVDVYHVPSEKTKNQIENLTNKPIFVNPFWVNSDIWFNVENQADLRKDLNLPDKYLIGSFQRDTEGHDLVTPKLEKGPDIFCDAVEEMFKENKDVEVVLAGWRRQYVMKRLNNAGIKYHYFELPSFEVINKLYNCLDLYIVGSRHEGGPQSIFECALTKTPIVSTDVGAASMILDKKSIFKPGNIKAATPNIDHANKSVQSYCIKNGAIRTFIESLEGLV